MESERATSLRRIMSYGLRLGDANILLTHLEKGEGAEALISAARISNLIVREGSKSYFGHDAQNSCCGNCRFVIDIEEKTISGWGEFA